jgi:hypothetical protein
MTLLSISCSDNSFEDVELSNTTLEELSLNLLNEIQEFTELSEIYELHSGKSNSLNVILHSKLNEIIEISKDYLTFFGFTEQDQKDYFNFDNDPRLVYVAMITATQQNGLSTYLKDNDRLLACASSALGIPAVRTILNSTNALTTATKVAQIAKHIGLRYLGYFGAAVAIYNFTKCIND